MSDLITADIEEIKDFLSKAQHIQTRMEDETHHIMTEFKNIYDWEDQIKDNVGRILEEINREEVQIFEYLEQVYRNVDEFSDELDEYLKSSKRY